MNKAFKDLFIPMIEAKGRKQLAPQIPFSANEICSPRITRTIPGWHNAMYINLSPQLYAVAVSPDGKPFILKGGLNYPLESGKYAIYYIVKEHRQAVIPKVSETTADGAQVSLELIINYRVSDPLKVLEVERPLETLIAFIKADLQEYIRSHTHDELLGDGAMRRIDDSLIAHHIKERHNTRHQLSKLFFIADIAVEERTGDPKLIEIRESYQVQQRQNITESELFRQKQELEKKVALQEAEIKRIKMESDANRQEIFQKLNNELETLRANRDLHQDKVRRGLDAIARYLEPSTYPRDPQIAEVAMELLHEINTQFASQLGAKEVQEEQAAHVPAAEAAPQKIDKLTDTLLRWLDRKPS